MKLLTAFGQLALHVRIARQRLERLSYSYTTCDKVERVVPHISKIFTTDREEMPIYTVTNPIEPSFDVRVQLFKEKPIIIIYVLRCATLQLPHHKV